MPRKPRDEDPGGIYHVNSQGSNERAIYLDRRDRMNFIAMLGRVALRHRWVVWAYCLMTNHYHLVLEIPFGGLSDGMKRLNGGYSFHTNVRYGWKAHLFRNRFFSARVGDDSHLLESCRYVVLNPVRAGLCKRPEEWPWSSYRACAGLELPPSFLAAEALLSMFGSRPKAAAQAYRDFVSAGQVRGQTPSQK